MNVFSAGHHVRGERDGSDDRSQDTFDFQNLHRVHDIVVGRIEDLDFSRDTLSIEGIEIELKDLERGFGTTSGYSWRVVEYDSDDRDSATGTQQWLLIDTGQGYAFYALEGARVTNGDGASQDSSEDGIINGDQEAHFIGARGGHEVTAAELAALPTIEFVDPQNYVPSGVSAKGGNTINDYDKNYAEVLADIVGTANGDLIAAGLNDDDVVAHGGDDRVWGGSGHDTIHSGAGEDTVRGGTGDDRIIGADGDDHLFGGTGVDVVSGWGGNDRVRGEDGDDRLYGNPGNDTLRGGEGDDKLVGSTGNDRLLGDDGDDLLIGGQGTDVMTGGGGADTFEFAPGDLMDWDTLCGSWNDKNDQLDLITGFSIGTDKIEFDGFSNVNGMSDLAAWKTIIDGNVHFTIQVAATNERILIDVHDSIGYSQIFDADNFSST